MSVIVRTYGWQLLLGNSPTGGLNWLLHALCGLTPVQVMYSEWAVVIASVHVFLPLMVLPLSASLGRIIRPSTRRPACWAPPHGGHSCGDTAAQHAGPCGRPDHRVSLTAGSYVTPQMVGGTRGLMLGVLLEQQINTAFDWPMAAAIAAVMVTIALVCQCRRRMALERHAAARLRRSGAR